MIEFRKWWNKVSGNAYFANITKKGTSKHTWRAAFELMLGWLDNSIEHKELADKIYEELEDEES